MVGYHNNKNLTFLMPGSIAQIAAQLEHGNREIIFTEPGLTARSVMRLVPTAQGVTRQLSEILGDLADSVKIELGLVPLTRTSEEGLQGYATGLQIPSEIPIEKKQAVVDCLNKFLTQSDRLETPTADAPVNVSTATLDEIIKSATRKARLSHNSAITR